MLPDSSPRAVYIDPQIAFRQLLVPAARMHTVGESALGADALPLCRARQPDLLVLAPPFPDAGVAGMVRAIGEALPTVCILLLGQVADLALAKAMQAGARGCVLKTEPLARLAEAIEAVGAGRRYLSPEAARLQAIGLTELTDRQCEVLAMIAAGLSTKQIAERLEVSFKTADHHRTRLMARLELHNLASVVRYAVRIGIAPL
jgi:DNA-binding NarL/FixJ family response regulator